MEFLQRNLWLPLGSGRADLGNFARRNCAVRNAVWFNASVPDQALRSGSGDQFGSICGDSRRCNRARDLFFCGAGGIARHAHMMGFIVVDELKAPSGRESDKSSKRIVHEYIPKL